MTRPRLSLLALTLLFVALPASATIEYRVSLAQPEQHLFRVTMTVPDVQDRLVAAMPAWNALYQIRDFAYRVQNVEAQAQGGQAVQVTKLDKQTWRIQPASSGGSPLGRVRIEYAVFWDEAGPFSSQLNSSHAFINPATILFYIPDRRGEDVRVEYGDVPESWRIAVALKPAPLPAGTGPGPNSWTFRAANYDALVDAPVEISALEESRFEVSGAHIRVVVHGTGWDRGALLDSVRRVVAYQVALMHEAPFEEFLFLYHFGSGSAGGGMEHANATAIDSSREPAAGVTAHEFFHVWNVKRIRPQSLEPACAEACAAGRGVDYSRENWTRALWFAEGVTSTYGAYTLVRTGLWTPQRFYADLAAEIGELESRPARAWQSAEQASLDAWFEKYPQYRQPEFSISYYNKGQILGVLLDILIRDATDNRGSLDNVLRHLNREFARRGRFYDERRDIRSAAEEIAGRDFGDFFARYVAGTDPLPYGDILGLAGLELTLRGRDNTIEEMKNVTEKQRRIREGLLRGTTD